MGNAKKDSTLAEFLNTQNIINIKSQTTEKYPL